MKNFFIFILIFLYSSTNLIQAYPPHKAMGYLPTPSNQPSSGYQSTPDYPFHQGYPDNSYEPAEHRGGSQNVQQSGDGVEIRCSIVRPMEHNRRPEHHRGEADRRPDGSDCHRRSDDCSNRPDEYNRPDDYNRRPDDYNRGQQHDDYNKRPDDYNRRLDEHSQMRHTREF
ncbi:hypothetical protein PVAND_005123 [Polypedilum vanderplanki]|uniref:Uncharacterized protein n=1 Tax=Polypedilum vanderplanki TaxID=319348 RepID=A0A9J6BZF4_POLVA|nr:hypothetical protein PVAND_005123 [Polypedilum vanderplanki]